jgi:hypothetical protein
MPRGGTVRFMRVLLIILLSLIAVAQIAAVWPILFIPTASLAAKSAPIVMATGAVISAIMLMRRSTGAYVPFFVAYAAFLALTAAAFGASSLPKAGLGLVVGLLFFVPSVRR